MADEELEGTNMVGDLLGEGQRVTPVFGPLRSSTNSDTWSEQKRPGAMPTPGSLLLHMYLILSKKCRYIRNMPEGYQKGKGRGKNADDPACRPYRPYRTEAATRPLLTTRTVKKSSFGLFWHVFLEFAMIIRR